MREFFSAVLIFICGLCFCQEKRIQYKEWDGKMCELIDYKKSASELILTIVPIEKQDTLKLIIISISPEVEELYSHIQEYEYADDGWVYKSEELGQKVLYAHFRAPFPGDTSIRANYLKCFFENKMFGNIE